MPCRHDRYDENGTNISKYLWVKKLVAHAIRNDKLIEQVRYWLTDKWFCGEFGQFHGARGNILCTLLQLDCTQFGFSARLTSNEPGFSANN
jgi:hypothetical protein